MSCCPTSSEPRGKIPGTPRVNNDLSTNGFSVSTPQGWNLMARGASTITILVLSMALTFTVYYVKEGFAAISKEHRAVARELAIGNCIQSLGPAEKKALHFNQGASWKHWCWWMPEE